MEEWKDIKGYEGYYKISSYGRVKGLRRLIKPYNCSKGYWIDEKIIKDGTSNGGYRMITLSKKGKNSIFRVHRLVAEAFIPNPYNKETVNHKDECVTNNHVDNLEWMTQAENNEYGTRKARQRVNSNVKGHQKDLSKDELTDCLIKGMTYKEISNKYHISKRTVISYAKDFGISKHKLLGTDSKVYKKVEIPFRELIDLLNYGFTTANIASLYDISIPTVMKNKRKYGLVKNQVHSAAANLAIKEFRNISNK